MLKKTFKILFFASFIAVLTALAIYFNHSHQETVCSDITIKINDTSHGEYISSKEINRLLENKKLHPKGQLLSNVSTKKLEDEIKKHPLVDHVNCYKTPSGKVGVDIYQRIPLIKIYAQSTFYLDTKGAIMPSGTKSTKPLIIASGNISKEFATNDLYNFAKFLDQNPFWNDQIEQIYVVNQKNIELIPRVGDHTITIGALTQFEDKLDRLKIFYDEVLSKVGWNKYSNINILFDNQIVCTKAK